MAVKNLIRSFLLIPLFLCFTNSSIEQKSEAYYQPNWESLKSHIVPKWFFDAKFGIYCHWGPYSVPANKTEWYSDYMYTDGHPIKKYHEEKYGPLSEFGFKDFIPMFTAENFHADERADLFSKAGARFAGPATEHTILLDKPAEEWIESLPLGNGHLGAVVFGGTIREEIGLNLSTLWSGGPGTNNEKASGAAHLGEIRTKIFNGELKEAEELCKKHLLGNKGNYGTHLPMGKILIDFEKDNLTVSNYSRDLDLHKAIASTHYTKGKVNYSHEVFASHPDNVIVIRIKADQKGAINLNLNFDSQGLPIQTRATGNTFCIEGDAFEKVHSDGKTGVHFNADIRVKDCDGIVQVSNAGIQIKQAGILTLLVAAGTDYSEPETSKRDLNELTDIGYSDLKDRHIYDYNKLYRRASLSLGSGSASQQHALFYNYARYLLIASSREDSPLPGNLQGIWNDNYACKMPWTCDFHLDINTQQNYWMAESGNLSECHYPLFRLIEGIAEAGRTTARILYGQPGWVAHVFTNAWGFTAPGWGLGWGLHVTGGIWIASHLWHHYEYTLDKDFLRGRAYPVLREAAIFFKNYLVKHPDLDYLVSGPSVSPENKYYDENGVISSETMGAVCDAVLIRDLFESCIAASEILEIDQDLRKSLRSKLDKLQPLMIGKHGQLQEWIHDYEDAVPNHRHTSHLIALYPSSQITVQETPELAKAAEKTIDLRLGQPDWEDVEWSRGNLINFYARLQNGEKALQHLDGLIKENAGISLLTYSRGGIAGAPQDIFVVDGNFAGAAGISEMLIQSFDNEIYLLPALPELWDQGEFRGICTRGGFEIDLIWENSMIKSVTVISKEGAPLNLNYNKKRISINTEVGDTFTLDQHLNPTK